MTISTQRPLAIGRVRVVLLNFKVLSLGTGNEKEMEIKRVYKERMGLDENQNGLTKFLSHYT